MAVSAPPEERSPDEVALLADALRSVPVLATLPEAARYQLCCVACYEQYEDGAMVGTLGATRGLGAAGGSMLEPSAAAARGLSVVLFGEVCLSRRHPAGGACTRAAQHADGTSGHPEPQPEPDAVVPAQQRAVVLRRGV